jgi:hypothetical protein
VKYGIPKDKRNLKTSNRKLTPVKASAFTMHLPLDYEWQLLHRLHDDVCQFLEESDNELLSGIIRSRDRLAYYELSEAWGLRSMSSSDGDLAGKRARYQLASFLKKFLFKASDGARKSAAVDTFLATEETCTAFNLEGWRELAASEDQTVVEVYTYAQSFVRKVIGEQPDHKDLNRSRHGPGTSRGTKKGQVSQYHKFANWPYSVTPNALRYGIAAVEADERWRGALEEDYRRRYNISPLVILNMDTFWRSVFSLYDGNRITTVPKNGLTDRSIAIEPTINLYLQLGVDGFIRKRLKRWGIDLNDQTKNQLLARSGSISGKFSTIDLKAASDSISLRLCELLLPPQWYNYLIDLRSPSGELEGNQCVYAKISSMGNGYTFALESLLFGSVLYGVLRALESEVSFRDCAVYGDDLIVPVDAVPLLVKMLGVCGFQLNLDKSFVQGPVRESCGTDWFEGKPVRPVFLTDRARVVTDLFSIHNRLKRVLSLYWEIGDESKVLQLIRKWIPNDCKTIIGPISDLDFDSCIHSSVPCKNYRYIENVWRYPTVLRMPLKMKAPLLHMRKLMAYLWPRCEDLRPENWEEFDLSTGSSAGGIFEVYMRDACRLAVKPSIASNWQSEYADVLTTGSRRH